jgi:small subunit ribosomal protein S6
MRRYEAMFIVKPDLNDEAKSAVMMGIKEQIAKRQGTVENDQIWSERRKLAYDLSPAGGQARYKEGMYYLVNFQGPPSLIADLKSSYRLNENVLRFLILKSPQEKGRQNV